MFCNFRVEKSKNDPLIKTPDGLALVKDVLYILKKVCQLTKEQKINPENNENENKPDEALAELIELTETANEDTNKSAATNKPIPGVGRGKRKREVTMPEAVNRFHINKINNNSNSTIILF